MRGEGPDRQGSGSAELWTWRNFGGNGKILILVTARIGEVLLFQRRNLWRNFCGEIFVLVLHTFEPPPKFATDPSPQNFTASLAEIFWFFTAQFVRCSGKAESRKFTTRLRDREVRCAGDLEVTGSIGNAVQCRITLGNLAQERNCRRLGPVSMLSERFWVVWSARGGHHLPEAPFRTNNATAMKIVLFCYRRSGLLFLLIRCHFSRKNDTRIAIAVVSLLSR